MNVANEVFLALDHRIGQVARLVVEKPSGTVDQVNSEPSPIQSPAREQGDFLGSAELELGNDVDDRGGSRPLHQHLVRSARGDYERVHSAASRPSQIASSIAEYSHAP